MQHLKINKNETPAFKRFYIPHGNYKSIFTVNAVASGGYFYGLKISLYNSEKGQDESMFLVSVNQLIDLDKKELLLKKFKRVDNSLRIYEERYLILKLLNTLGFEYLKKKLVVSNNKCLELKKNNISVKYPSRINTIDSILRIHNLK